MSTAIPRSRLVIGTRGSLLARAQTEWVVERLRAVHRDLEIVTEVITTSGDREQTRPLPEVGGKGVFTEELERALLDGSIDLAVHSAKDLPTKLKPGLGVLAYPPREDPRDAWVSADGSPFEALPAGAVVGTTSLRRQAQLLMRRTDLTFIGLRGNVDTRIGKVRRGDCAGAVLAMAGLIRSGLVEHVTHPFEPDVMLPAPGQGALAIEGRADDARVRGLLAGLQDAPTAAAVECERAILDELDAGCRAPVAVFARVEGKRLTCRALVVYPDGSRPARAHAEGDAREPGAVAEGIVRELRGQGVDAIIASCRSEAR